MPDKKYAKLRAELDAVIAPPSDPDAVRIARAALDVEPVTRPNFSSPPITNGGTQIRPAFENDTTIPGLPAEARPDFTGSGGGVDTILHGKKTNAEDDKGMEPPNLVDTLLFAQRPKEKDCDLDLGLGL